MFGLVILAILVTWLLAEIFFYALIRCVLLPKLERPTENQVAWFKKPDDILRGAFQLIKQHSHYYTFHDFVSGFCNKANIKHIHSTHFERFLAWAIYGAHIDNLSAEEKNVVTSLQLDASTVFDMNWAEEASPEITHCKFSLEDLDYIHHPLLLHAFFRMTEWYYTMKHLRTCGYTKQSFGTATYWIKEVPTSSLSPIIIFHGICSGWFSYATLIEGICKNRTVILYDNDSIKHCSMNFHVQTAHELCDNLRGILRLHKIEQITVCGHSWGTFWAGWVVRIVPELINHMVLVDPVCLTIFFPESTYTLLYKPSVSLNDYLVEYFVRGDLSISYVVRRHFIWYNSVLGLDEIPHNMNTTFVLSSDDKLVPFSIVSKMIDDFVKRVGQNCTHITKVVWHNKDHAYGTNDKKCVSELNEIMLKIKRKQTLKPKLD